MTLVPFIYGIYQPMKKFAPRWIFRRTSPIMVNEGEPHSMSMVVNNYKVGSKIVLWFTGGSSMASSGNWERSWHKVLEEKLAEFGCTYMALSSKTTPVGQGTLSGLITIGAGYQGQTIVFTNVSRKNRRTNATNEDGTPGYREMQFLLTNQGAAGSAERDLNGTGAIQGGNLMRLLDTSRTPSGTPKLRLRLIDADGNAGSNTMEEGDTFGVEIVTENIRPDTKLKMYPADAKGLLSPDLRSELRRAGRAAGCTVFLPQYLDDPKAYYDGGEVTFTDTYDNAKPVRMIFTLKDLPEDVNGKTFYILSILTAEGDVSDFDEIYPQGDWNSSKVYKRGDWVTYLADGGKYIYTSESDTAGNAPTNGSFWRPYTTTQTSATSLTLTVKKRAPRLWELRAVEEGGTITYAINAPLNAANHSVAFASNNAPPGFNAALSGALGERMTLVNGRLVAGIGGEIFFSVPLAGSGKHTMRITDPQTDPGTPDVATTPIVIGDTCVYLTLPTLRPMLSKYWGVNLCGGDFTSGQIPGTYGTHYVYPSQPESTDPVKQHQEMDYHARKGMDVFRVPFKWERVQRELFGPLFGDGGTGSWSGSQDIRRLDELVTYAEGLGIPVMLDCHNYAGRKDKGKIAYDNAAVPVEAIIDFWVKMAQRYANRNVWFDFMNEPSGAAQNAQRVADWMQWLLNAVRARTDALNFCLIEGCNYSSAQSWVSIGQANAFDEFYDPARNFAFSPHNYVDEDAAGLSGRCVVGSSRLSAITNWARAKPAARRLFLGEIQGGDPAVSGQEGCAGIMKQCYDFLRDNPEWLGVTIWGGGRFTGKSYWGRVDPQNYQTGEDTGVMKMILPYLA